VPPRGRRPSGGPDTREEILEAARVLFAEKGFERTTMRAVGERAGVDPALIAHYFGNKDGLLNEALSIPVDLPLLLADLDESHPGVDIVRRVLHQWDTSPQLRRRMIGLLRTGLSHEHAAAMLRGVLSRTILATLQKQVVDDQRELRTTLIGSHIAGLLMARYVLRLPALADADSEQIAVAVGPVVQHYLSGPIATVPARRTRRSG
jgi:AcrR family transcriptional regulator